MKYFYVTAGFISMALGIIGILLPIMPTVPFLLFTAFCFGKGSKKFSDWFLSTRLYKFFLERFIKTRSMPLKLKIIVLAYVTIATIVLFFFISSTVLRAIMVTIVAGEYFILIFKIKNSDPKKTPDLSSLFHKKNTPPDHNKAAG